MNNTLKSQPILIPNDNIDKEKWAVVSCDQFTSQRDYWKKLEEFVGSEPSTLGMIFPEVYLEDNDGKERIEKINQTMRSYMADGTFKELKDKFVLVERDTKYGMKRLGLITSVDLDDFVYDGSKKTPIRSTEGVVASRIPVRLEIRNGAPIELPHIILLIDDRKKVIIEKMFENKESLEKLYDFDLNMDGGHLRGYAVDAQKANEMFEVLYDENEQIEKYGEASNFVLAVGDGNHSLATAKAYWEQIKATLSDEEKENHPARFALCEIENLHCDGIVFEPIHRVVFGADNKALFEKLSSKLSGDSKAKVFFDGEYKEISIPSFSPLAIKEIENACQEYLNEKENASIDYIHGENNLIDVANEQNGLAICMPSLDKNDLFKYVLQNGALCKKSFSMGEAEEKRYYYEAKKLEI